LQHFDIGQQMVGEEHRLCSLEVGIAGDEHLGVFLSQTKEGSLKALDLGLQGRYLVKQPQAHVEGHLVVAGPASMEFGAGGGSPSESCLDVHMDVFEVGPPLEAARLDLPADCLEVFQDFPRF
jgi:hypothetical protein